MENVFKVLTELRLPEAFAASVVIVILTGVMIYLTVTLKTFVGKYISSQLKGRKKLNSPS